MLPAHPSSSRKTAARVKPACTKGTVWPMFEPMPIVQDVVLLGGGHAHALFLRMWGMNPQPGVRVTVVNPGPAAPYTGMLPGLIAGHYTRDQVMIDLIRLARFAGARILLDRAVGIDRAARRILLQGGDPLPYDIISLDIGIQSDLPQVPGFSENAHAAKPLGDYAAAWERFVARALPHPQVVIIGAGVGGVELALASANRLTQGGGRPQITLLDRGAHPLAALGRAARKRLLDALRAAGVTLLTGAEVAHIAPDRLHLTDGRILMQDFTLSVAGTRAQGWLADTGLALKDGFVAVGPTLQSSDPSIFAVGDCAHLTHAPRPKAGVYAVRAAGTLHHNVRAALTGDALRPFWPQRDYLKLISMGNTRAVAGKYGQALGGAGPVGAWLWRHKDRIDRRFMARFAEYPVMPRPLPKNPVRGLAQALGPKPMCGGCGAKVGPATLGRALDHLPRPARADVVMGRGDDAAILTTGAEHGLRQVITTDHLRATCHDPRRMARIAAIHALGDVWAMGAAPQVALAQIILPPMSEQKQAETLAEVMAEASAIFTKAGAVVAGGHTTIGAELTLGFTVTGLAERPITKAGAQPGDALIVTKAIGSGTVMAAEMALTLPSGAVLGEWVAQTWASMDQPMAQAAALLAPHAHAMTDVTGFGLAGHVLEMLAASDVGAVVDLAALPLLPGAVELAAMGVASTLAPANRAATQARMDAPMDDPRTALLFDPQTAGPLLAAVPPERAAEVVQALRDIGAPAAVIGQITAGPVRLTLR